MTLASTRTLYSPSPLNPYYLLCLADGTGWYVPDSPLVTSGGWTITPDDLEGRDVVLSSLSDVEVFALCNEEDPLPEILRRRAFGASCEERAAEAEARAKAAETKVVQLEAEIARLRDRLKLTPVKWRWVLPDGYEIKESVAEGDPETGEQHGERLVWSWRGRGETGDADNWRDALKEAWRHWAETDGEGEVGT